MDEDGSRPLLRPIEAFPVEAEGRTSIAIRDPAGWSDSVLLLSSNTLFALSCFDGRHTLRDVQAACSRRFSAVVPLDQIRAVADALDAALLLDSDSFRRHRAALEESFLASAVRPAAHAGGAYDAEPDALRKRLDALLRKSPPDSLPGGEVVGLIAPHIDLDRGGEGYGAAYRALRERCDAKTFVILGTAHAAPKQMYIATRKAYETPLGAVETDADFIEALAARYGPRIFDEEITHRNEHSIEFQAVFLRYLFSDRRLRIVPILCSSLHENVEASRLPGGDPGVAAFVRSLRETLRERPDVCLIAAADLAHLGPRFGDPLPLSEAEAASCDDADRRTLGAAARRDAAGFFTLIAEERDRRRVCGLSPIYTLVESLPGSATGTLLHYGQALDPKRTTFVSFASMIFTAPAGARSV